MANLNAEVPVGDSFDTVLENVQSDWTDALSRVTVNDDNASHSNLTVFYTAVYHSLCAPTLFSEVFWLILSREENDLTNEAQVGGMYLGFDGKVHTIASDSEGYYTDLSIWDVFRTQMPFLGFVFPTVMRDIARSLVLMYQQGGDLPRWPLANGYTNGMMGNVHAFFAFTVSIGLLKVHTICRNPCRYRACWRVHKRPWFWLWDRLSG